MRDFLRAQAQSGRLVAVFLLLALVAVYYADPKVLEIARIQIFDLYQNIKPRQVRPARPAVIVDLDERSLKEVGQWPWPRSTVARIVGYLSRLGAAVIAFDIVFAEPDRLSPTEIERTMPNLDPALKRLLMQAPDNDEILASAIAKAPVVTGQPILLDAALAPPGTRLSLKTLPLLGHFDTNPMRNYPSLLPNLEIFSRAAKAHGIFSLENQDAVDGIVRQVPLVMRVDDKYYPSLALAALQVATASDSPVVKVSPEFGVEGVRVPPNFIETDSIGRLWVYFSHRDKKKYISAVDVLQGKVAREAIEGKIIFFGTSAGGLLDIRSSPIDKVLPGVEVHTQVIENILGGTQLHRPVQALLFELLTAVGLSVLIIVLLPITGARATLFVMLLAVIVMGLTSWYAFAEFRTLYDPVFPSLMVVILYIQLSYFRFVREERQRQDVRNAFSHYLAPEVVQQLAANPKALNLGGEKRDLTIMFTDIRGFTNLSEKMPAEELTQFINDYLTPMSEIVLKNGGTIDKYIGDCIMAFWNAPLEIEDHAAKACQSTLEMEECLAELNAELERKAKEAGTEFRPIRVGIGVNTGAAVVGNIGSRQRFNYSVLGDTVNVSSRLEQLTKTYRVIAIIGEDVYRQASGYAALEIDLIRVRGREQAQHIYALLGDETLAANPDFQALKQLHDEMIAAYREGDVNRAGRLLHACQRHPLATSLATVYQIYANRLRRFRDQPPQSNWDGVFEAAATPDDVEEVAVVRRM